MAGWIDRQVDRWFDRRIDRYVDRKLDAFLAAAQVEVVPFDEEQAHVARSAFERFGKGRHRAALPPPVRRDHGGLGRLVEIPLTRIEPGEYELVLDLEGEVDGGATFYFTLGQD